jgi:hypothetical protein
MMMSSKWKCLECGREFANKNQWHSCVTMTVDDLLEDKPENVGRTLKKLITEVKKLGDVTVDTVKTGINLGARAHFGMIFVQKSGINLEFELDRKIDDPRFAKVWPELMTGNYAYRVKLTKEEDVDKKLLGWLKKAYSLKS